ncbi:uncharacterized protein LOC115615819 [Strigops habroptila]|uniref:uncharacterized protein LOC115615819 n=1 Tax=Strigops habroptila TaxID=2489341 RepID=UPI0011CEE0E5|nr:uncharacterized protein LOC115615819 [Strigops habroptila]XP_030360306.1 uncharacterized protein LOC115615819 [Strigops habroptila]XP_030360307.1 uncharacterized protein LOC115615819 [Strigops habroptila]
MKSDELPGDLETGDETTPPPSSPGVWEHVLLTRDSPEDLHTKLLLCNDHSFPDYLVFALSYLPYYRTSHLLTSPSFLPASHISTETEESFDEGKVDTKQDEKVSYSAVSTGYFPYYRTYEELLGQPLTHGLNVEEKRPDNDGKDESEGDAESTTPLSLELDKRVCSPMTDEEPPAQQLLRDSTTAHCLSTSYFPSGLPGLDHLFGFSGYFPYYQTEGELCTDPVLEDRSFTGMEALENKEGGHGGEIDIWSLRSSCLVC